MPNNNKQKKVGYQEKNTMPPLGILSIGTYLRLHGYEVAYLDLFANRISRTTFLQFLKEFNPGLVGISTYTESYAVVKQVAKMIKQVLPETKQVLGGPHVSFLPEECLHETVADYVSRGEGEMTFAELLEYLNYGTIKLEQIKGLSYWKDNQIIHNPQRGFIEKLDCLPLPAMDEEQLSKYKIKQLIITSRGCPGQCVYCASAALSGRKYRARSAEHIFSELHFKYHVKGESYFAFLDDTFTANKRRLYKFCDYVMKSGMKIVWRCDSRTDILSCEMIDKIKEAGCIAVHVGVESGSQEVIDNINKHINLEKTKALVKYMYEQGLSVMCSFIVGHHCDTEETIEKTISLAEEFRDCYHANVGIGLNTPFPGTVLYNERDRLGVKIENPSWSSFDLVQAVISTKNMTQEELQNAYFKVLERIES